MSSFSTLPGWTLVKEIVPDKDTISINQIKDLIHALTLKTSQSQRHLFVIRDGDLMTLPAQNCLLKTLEECADNNLIIIVTSNANKLLPTILSRCQIETKSIPFISTPLDPPIGDWAKTNFTLLTDQILKHDPKTYFLSVIATVGARRDAPHPSSLRGVLDEAIYINKIQQAALICLDDLSKNINPKLALDHFFLSTIPTPGVD